MNPECFEVDVWISLAQSQAALAMSHGARWDRVAKHWYAPAGTLKAPLARWQGGPCSEAAAHGANRQGSSLDYRAELALDIQNAVGTNDQAMIEERCAQFWALDATQDPWPHWGAYPGADKALRGASSASTVAERLTLPKAIKLEKRWTWRRRPYQVDVYPTFL